MENQLNFNTQSIDDSKDDINFHFETDYQLRRRIELNKTKKQIDKDNYKILERKVRNYHNMKNKFTDSHNYLIILDILNFARDNGLKIN